MALIAHNSFYGRRLRMDVDCAGSTEYTALHHQALEGKQAVVHEEMSIKAGAVVQWSLPKEITELYPNAPHIKRNGEVDSWDNAEFRQAIKDTGKSQIILAGIITDVCTLYLALSLRAEGYTVFANTEASGTFNKELAADANRRMENAGVILMGMFSVVADLMRDWRATPGSLTLLPFFDKYLPAYGYVARAHEGAVLNGALMPGELGL